LLRALFISGLTMISTLKRLLRLIYGEIYKPVTEQI
jgi:hypothetical protein